MAGLSGTGSTGVSRYGEGGESTSWPIIAAWALDGAPGGTQFASPGECTAGESDRFREARDEDRTGAGIDEEGVGVARDLGDGIGGLVVGGVGVVAGSVGARRVSVVEREDICVSVVVGED